ncbi:DNA/RNA non-specific endonuclease [Streptococcus halichoeri]|uniref:DNA/RNA non-specific endonuclease n=1 Tax=Streptococcus halichoeri TaxID=254785 RepID=UPI0013573EC5|nr:DNA/RNA non-specific endonuclease [Streptococcus halichoeri]
MKPKKFSPLQLSLLLVILSLTFLSDSLHSSVVRQPFTQVIAEAKTDSAAILPFKHKRQLILGKLDEKGRATYAHIQLQSKDEPTHKRHKRLKTKPVGWHNFKFYYEDGSKKAWLMKRGHLIGYQFSGLNNQRRNLVPMTSWLSTGHYKKRNADNQDSMLYYEKRLNAWLAQHKNAYLDYKVTAIYQNDELIPRKITLQYVGLDKSGQLLPIEIGGKAVQDAKGISRVTLDNVSPNADIDYLTGQAQNTVLSAKEQKRKAQQEAQARKQAEEAAAQKAAQEKQAKEEAERQRQAAERAARQAAEAERQAAARQQANAAQEQTQAPSQQGGGYFRDVRGRWHRPNGQYASKAEIAAAGLPWK